MIDTLKLSIIQGEDIQYDYSEVASRLDKINQSGTNKHGEFINGSIGPLFFVITPHSIRLFKGSLAKYWYETNAVEMTRRSCKEALLSLNDQLGVEFTKARVSQVDFGINVCVTEAPSRVFKTLGNAKGYTRLEQDQGLYYKNTKFKMVFYDKGKEQQKKKQKMPGIFESKWIVRYEIRIQKPSTTLTKIDQSREEVGTKTPTRNTSKHILAEDLVSETVYSQLYSVWLHEFQKIKPIKPPAQEVRINGSTKDLLMQLAAAHARQIGIHNLLDEVDAQRKSGQIQNKQAFDLKNTLRKLDIERPDEEPIGVIQEFTTKIKQLARFQR